MSSRRAETGGEPGPAGARPNPTYFPGDLPRALLDAASQVVAEGGAAKMSLREVARRVGVSHAAPAHHFGDKEGLLTALAAEGFDRLDASLRDALHAARGRSARQRLVATGHGYLVFARANPSHYAVMFRHDLVRADDETLAASSSRAFSVLLDGVAAAQADGWAAERDTLDLAVASWGIVHGLATLEAAGALDRVGGEVRVSSSLDALFAALADD